MASPPFEVEDHADDEFFDKLVDDYNDRDLTGSGPSFVENEESDVGKAFPNLSTSGGSASKVDSGDNVDFEINGKKGYEDGAVSASLESHEDNFDAEDRNFSAPAYVTQSNDGPMELKAGLDCNMNDVPSGTGVKEVDWSSFKSVSHRLSGSGTGDSDFFNELGDSSGDLYGKVAENSGVASNDVVSVSEITAGDLSSFSSVQHQEGQYCESGVEQTTGDQDFNSRQYWENLYPGWRYDANSGQWHQLENHSATATSQESFDTSAGSVGDGVVTEPRSDLYYFQQTLQSSVGSVADGYKGGSVSNWNQGSQGNVEYPAHMVFDPQYPGWYYDTIAQEWRSLESYAALMRQPTFIDHNQLSQNVRGSAVESLPEKAHSAYDNFEQIENFGSQRLTSKDQAVGWARTPGNQIQQSCPEPVAKGEVVNYIDNQQLRNLYGSNHQGYNFADQQRQQMWYRHSGTATSFERASQSFDITNGVPGFQSFTPAENFSQHLNQHKREPSQQIHFSSAHCDSQKTLIFSQQLPQSGTQFYSVSNEERSSVGRPPHALVTFGFGGKLIVMKNNDSFPTNSGYGCQDSVGGVINIVNLMELVMDKADSLSIGLGVCDYFSTLCQQSFPGPLVGVNVGIRELNKWLDEKIAKCETSDMNYRKGELLRLLFSLLKISCQCYGKLRSPFGTDQAMKESDSPESAIAKLFASAKRNVSEYGAIGRCLQNFPSEEQIQATALEVQKLLVSGRIKEALRIAQDGQLWGPALVLATQLGDQFYGDTVKQMAVRQLVDGSPLRTLCLLIAGQPADVFSSTTNVSSLTGSENNSQQPAQIRALSMLHEWEENLAIITANRTKNDELVIIHLGDCLWKDKGEVIAAHICYLVAEANFASYSDSARLCLIGADHWRSPRTYASPEAIQSTELYEYSKVLGNPQFLLLPFQPYKLIYAHMLAEVGKLSDSLKYCQAILKCLKTGRAPEVDTWKHLVSSLEERLRIHQQGGYSTNLAPAKLVGKLLNLFDSTAHRVVGGLPPPIPSHGKAQHEHDRQKAGPGVSNSQSTMAMSSLMPSTSMERISEWTGGSNRMTKSNRSISEPDFGKKPIKKDKASSHDMQERTSGLSGSSRFGRFGSQIFQKTVGLVLRSRADRQAKLGDTNKFYYDENLKQWVEEGTEPPAEEAALPPPPTTLALQNRISNENLKDGPKNENLHCNDSSKLNSGIPPIPPSSHQFAARGRTSVRARYVDTFNKGGGHPRNLFQSTMNSPSPKPVGDSNTKFFVPSPVSSPVEKVPTIGNENPCTPTENVSLLSPPTFKTSVSMQRISSMDNIMSKRIGSTANGKSPIAPHSRRTASWSGGSFSGASSSPSKMAEMPSPTFVLGDNSPKQFPAFVLGDNSPKQCQMSGSRIGDDLHEVQL